MSKKPRPKAGTSKSAVYALQDDDGVVRYVGKTVDPAKRLSAHVRADTIRTGAKPALIILEWAEDWETAERRWIAHYRALGAPLVNVSAGGLDMEHVRAESRKYPAYAWLARYYARRGLRAQSIGLQKKARDVRLAHGHEGMAGFNAHIRGLLREMLPFAAGASA